MSQSLLAGGQRVDDVHRADLAQHDLLERRGAKVHIVQPRTELAD